MNIVEESHTQQRMEAHTYHEYRFRVENAITMSEAIVEAETQTIGEVRTSRAYKSASGNWIVSITTIQYH